MGKNFDRAKNIHMKYLLALRGYIIFWQSVLSLCILNRESPSQSRVFKVYSFATRKLMYLSMLFISINVKIWNSPGTSISFLPTNCRMTRSKSDFPYASHHQKLGLLCRAQPFYGCHIYEPSLQDSDKSWLLLLARPLMEYKMVMGIELR